VEVSTVIENLIDARKSRRRIVELLTKQQIEDSCCAEKLKQVALEGKRGLLELLGAWLVSFEPDKEVSGFEEGVFAAINIRVSLKDWLSLQHREAELNKKQMEACSVEGELYKVYDRVAPNGVLSIWLRKGAEKAKAERLQVEYRSAKASRELIDVDLLVVRKEIRKTIGLFLSDAVKPEPLEILAKQSRIKDELASLIRKLEENGMSVWGAHAQEQLSSLSELEKETAKLSQVYSTANPKPREQTVLSAHTGEK
jgi:hypothetical protein